MLDLLAFLKRRDKTGQGKEANETEEQMQKRLLSI
jgi:hypothetical protein